MKQKVVQVVTQMEAGGAQRAALLLHHEMLRQGVAAELWFLYSKTEAYSDELAVHSFWRTRPRFYELPVLWVRLWKALKCLRPHLLITHTHYANAFAQPMARVLNIPNRLAVHHNEPHTYPAPGRALERWLKRTGVFTASIAVSDSVRHSLIKMSAALYSSSTRRIYNGLPLNSSNGGAPLTGLIELPPGFSEHKVLLNVGRLAEQKNQRALIAALEFLPDCVAIIAGRGPLEEPLLAQARDSGVDQRLHLLGEISNDQVAAWMHRADVFVFPSWFEAMPMALLEAMRNGMTIVASDIPAHRELAGETALLSSTEPLALAASIRTALQPHNRHLGESARERSHEFTIKAMADAYLEMH